MKSGISIMPRHLQKLLKEYLLPNEKVLDAIKEVFTFDIDFRWIVLTSQRIILVTRRFLDYNFRDFFLDNLDIDVDLDFIYDELIFMNQGKTYKAQFYTFSRARTLAFFNGVKKFTSHRKDSLRDAIMGEKLKKEIETKAKIEEVAEDLKSLKILVDKGIITWWDYERKKKDLLNKL